MRSNAPAKQCEKCFSNVQTLFGEQVDLMRSLQIYNTDTEKKQEISVLPAVLTELTGLRGGNLLFHVQKLLDSGMILQRHERGDYMITDKGFKVLRSIGDMYSVLSS